MMAHLWGWGKESVVQMRNEHEREAGFQREMSMDRIRLVYEFRSSGWREAPEPMSDSATAWGPGRRVHGRWSEPKAPEDLRKILSFDDESPVPEHRDLPLWRLLPAEPEVGGLACPPPGSPAAPSRALLSSPCDADTQQYG